MKAENGLGGIVKLDGKWRKPYMIRYTKGYIINGVTGKKEQVFKVIGYAWTIKEAKKIREDFNKRGRCDLGFTFSDIYEKWSQEHFKMVSPSAMKENNYIQMILIMIYIGVTVDEFISLEKENVYLDKRYIEIVGTKSQKSKGIRIVPISHKIEPYIRIRMDKNSEYLFTTDKGRNFKYRDFKDSYFDMVMKDMGWNYTPNATIIFQIIVQNTLIKECIKWIINLEKLKGLLVNKLT